MTNPLHEALFARHEGSASTLISGPGDPVSYGTFLARADALAHGLLQAGVEPGDRVAVQVHKSWAALALYAACVKAGIVFLPLNTAYTPAEVAYFVSDAQAALLVCDPDDKAALEPVANEAGARMVTMDRAGQTSLGESATGPFETVERTGADIAAILYTSGTTGRSKGAMLTQDNLLSNARSLALAWRWQAEDVLLHALPIFHTHGLFVACNVTFLAGSSMHFLPSFDRNAIIAALPAATTMMGVPTFYTRLLDDPRFDRALVGHMRLFTSGSAPLLAETHVSFEKRTGLRILERYGMTETNMNTSNPYDGERR
ncbi:AMP-binding protein, partial [Rhizobiaceae bacterium]|nr:AMP-binding protein [Rhizobiaceae bacterium]